jgi:hypothetical protein
LITKLVTTAGELQQIADLSFSNLSTNISKETKATEGFVSWSYPIATLNALHSIVPSVIVKDGDMLAGYALSLTRECVKAYPTMIPTLAHLSTMQYKGRSLDDSRLYLMGQICVRKDFRGQGIVGMLYQYHRQQFSDQYDMLLTEISTANPRSLKAHEKVGFKIIDCYREGQDDWNVVLWDWME